MLHGSSKRGAHFRSYCQFQKPQQWQLNTIMEPSKPSEAHNPEREREQAKFAKPDDQFNGSVRKHVAKANNRGFTQRTTAMARLSHNVNLQTILNTQQIYKQRKWSKRVSDTTADENMDLNTLKHQLS